MKSGKGFDGETISLKKPVRILIVFGLVCLPIFGCGKSDSVKTVATPEQIDVNSILEGASDDVTKTDADNIVENSSDTATQASIADDSELTAVASEDSTTQTDVSATNSSENDTQADPSVDVDLTALSATMVYSEVFQMMYYPEDYVGKTVKMEGLYDHFHDDSTGKDYYACIIQDATACCAQGIEFRLSDGEYPADSTNDVAVRGTFEIYEENGAKYCTLMDAELVE